MQPFDLQLNGYPLSLSGYRRLKSNDSPPSVPLAC